VRKEKEAVKIVSRIYVEENRGRGRSNKRWLDTIDVMLVCVGDVENKKVEV